MMLLEGNTRIRFPISFRYTMFLKSSALKNLEARKKKTNSLIVTSNKNKFIASTSSKVVTQSISLSSKPGLSKLFR